MNEDARSSIGVLLRGQKTRFLDLWRSRVVEAAAGVSPNKQDWEDIGQEDFGDLFDAYVQDMLSETMATSQGLILKLVKSKVTRGLSLSMLEFINASFMSTAREIFREAYPDAFNTRMEYLERLSQMVLSNEIALAQYYEEYLNDLNRQLREHADALKRRNDTLFEFMDLATHELQAPLWSILGFVAKVQRRYHSILDENGRHCLDRIATNVSEMHQLIEDVTEMLMIDRDNMTHRECPLSEILEEANRRVKREVDEDFRCEGLSELSSLRIWIKGDPRHLKQAFFQVIKNSAIYSRSNEPGVVRVRHTCEDDLHLYLEDDGIGIEERFWELVFKPMERLKERDAPGTGMGLTFARRIITAHGGSVRIEDPSFSKGTCIHFTFPISIVRQEV